MFDVIKYIKENKYLSKFKWDISIVNHTSHQIGTSRLNYPKYNVHYQKGIYVFINQQKQILYVGQARSDLTERLRFRFKELHGKGDKDYIYHEEFFQSFQDSKMIILTTEISNDKHRNLAEEYLTVYLQPKFIEFKFEKFYPQIH